MPRRSWEGQRVVSEIPGDGPVMRLCVLVADGPSYTGRSEVRQCVGCGEDVWYDPHATVDILREIIICYRPGMDEDSCFAEVMDVPRA